MKIKAVLTKISPSTVEGDKSVMCTFLGTNIGDDQGFGSSTKNYYVTHATGQGISVGMEKEFDMSQWKEEAKTISREIDGEIKDITITRLIKL